MEPRTAIAIGSGVVPVLAALWKGIPYLYSAYIWHRKPDDWITSLKAYGISFESFHGLSKAGVQSNEELTILGTEQYQRLIKDSRITVVQEVKLEQFYNALKQEAPLSVENAETLGLLSNPPRKLCKFRRCWSICCISVMITAIATIAFLVFAPQQLSDSIYVFGGYDGNISDFVERFHVPTGSWSKLPPIPGGAKYAFAAAAAGDSIFLFGGWNGDKSLDIVKRLMPTGTWSTLPPMPGGARYGIAAATSGDSIFLFGGENDGHKELDIVERFQVPTGIWSTPPPMSGGARSYCAAVAFGNSIFLFGGDAGKGQALDNVERFHVPTGTWSTLPPMPGGARHGLSAVASGDSIFLFGGKTSTQSFDIVERFHVPTGTWSTLPPIPSGARIFFSAVVFGDSIFLFGGYDGSKSLAIVERFHVPTGTWSLLSPMPAGARSFVVAARAKEFGLEKSFPGFSQAWDSIPGAVKLYK